MTDFPKKDRQWVAGLIRGEVASFDAVYRAYRPRVFSFLARLSGDPCLAEDLLQETFMRLARNAHRLDMDTRLHAWLLTVARNLFISHRRWALLDLDRVSELRLWKQAQGPSVTPFAAAAANQTQALLEQALAALPLPHREVLLLVTVEQLSPTEAATVLGLKPEAVRQRLSRARGMLKRLLDG